MKLIVTLGLLVPNATNFINQHRRTQCSGPQIESTSPSERPKPAYSGP